MVVQSLVMIPFLNYAGASPLGLPFPPPAAVPSCADSAADHRQPRSTIRTLSRTVRPNFRITELILQPPVYHE